MRVTIHSRQSFLDIALQECGSFEAAYTLAERNGLSMTDDLTVGQELEFQPADITRKNIVAALAAYRVKPATAIRPEERALLPWGGINYMGVEIDFVVS
nr:MAG TPA: hypothetical protein [Caudoviricetes sp.]